MSAGPTPPGPVKPKALNCPNCGAALTLRSFEHALTVVCGSCNSILDAKDPNLKILQEFRGIMKADTPLVPLGRKGKIRGTQYEVIGFQRRTINVEGQDYSWREYLLFNPYKGFRYLTEYDGHWNDVSTLRAVPHLSPGGTEVTYLGETYKNFQNATAKTTFVLGEFPWQVRVGEKIAVSDFISPPRVLSSEKTEGEVTWSLGEYMTGDEVWKAFALQGSPPPAIGVYENQPSPSKGAGPIWKMFAFFGIVAFVLLLGLTIISRNEVAFSGNYSFDPNVIVQRDNSFVTDIFELKGHTANVEVQTSANVDNSWIYINYALINSDTGEAWDFGREVSFYSGRDEDGLWTEGSHSDSVTVPTVPPGHYYLRVEPESDRGLREIQYTVTLKRDVPQFSFFLLALLALAIPAAIATWRSLSFERQRWAESDFPMPGINFEMTGDSDDE